MFFIAVCGLSGSGKSYISRVLKKFLNKNNFNTKIISLDMFYKDFSEYSNEQKKNYKIAFSEENQKKNIRDKFIFNYDDPTLINTNRLIEILTNIKKGKSIIKLPIYHFGKKNRTFKYENFTNTNCIIVEGLFLFYEIFNKYQNFFNYKIFVDVVDNLDKNKFNENSMFSYFAKNKNNEIQIFLRRYYRDKSTRKNNVKFLDYLYNWEYVMNSSRQYILPYKYLADIIINNNEEVELIDGKINYDNISNNIHIKLNNILEDLNDMKKTMKNEKYFII